MSMSTAAQRALQSTRDPDGFLELITIDGDDMASPIRLVNDSRDLISSGFTFLRSTFELTWPKDAPKEVARAQLRISNPGRDLVAELEALPPGAELQCMLQTVYRIEPDAPIRVFGAPLRNVNVTPLVITGTISVSEVMNRPAVNLRYDPYTAPGLFTS